MRRRHNAVRTTRPATHMVAGSNAPFASAACIRLRSVMSLTPSCFAASLIISPRVLGTRGPALRFSGTTRRTTLANRLEPRHFNSEWRNGHRHARARGDLTRRSGRRATSAPRRPVRSSGVARSEYRRCMRRPQRSLSSLHEVHGTIVETTESQTERKLGTQSLRPTARTRHGSGAAGWARDPLPASLRERPNVHT